MRCRPRSQPVVSGLPGTRLRRAEQRLQSSVADRPMSTESYCCPRACVSITVLGASICRCQDTGVSLMLRRLILAALFASLLPVVAAPGQAAVAAPACAGQADSATAALALARSCDSPVEDLSARTETGRI